MDNSNTFNSCSVYGCKFNYKTKRKVNYVTVFKIPDKTTKQEEWLRKLPNKGFQITKTSRVCIKHFEPHFIKRHDVFPCANGDSDIIVSIENTILSIVEYR